MKRKVTKSSWCERALSCAGATAVSGVMALVSAAPAGADDIEVFFGERPSQVNILFVLDTSFSMWTVEGGSTDIPYLDYKGSWRERVQALNPSASVCATDAVFYAAPARGGNPAPIPQCSDVEPGILNGSGTGENRFSCVMSNGDLEAALLNSTEGVLLLPQQFAISQRINNAWVGQTPTNADVPTLCRLNGVVASPRPDGVTDAPNRNSQWQTLSGSLYSGDRLNYEIYRSLTQGTRMSAAIDAALAAMTAPAVVDANARFGVMRYSGANSISQSCNLGYYTTDTYQDYLASLDGGDGTGQAGGGMLLAPIEALDFVYPSASGFSVGRTPPYDGTGVHTASDTNQDARDGYAGQTQREKLEEIFTFAPGTDRGLQVAPNNATDCAVPALTPNGRTPIAETLLEIRAYLRGETVVSGTQSNVGSSHPWPSDAITMSHLGDYPRTQNQLNASRYRSPITEACRPVTAIILLSDGGTEQDSPAIETTYRNLSGGKACDDDGLGTANSPSRCVDDLAELLHEEMGVSTYTIIYKVPDANQRQMLRDAAERSGGTAFEAEDAATLFSAFNAAVSGILTTAAAFSSPTVAVNAFNRTQNADQVFVSMFEPSSTYRWNGNTKRYRLTPTGELYDNSSPPKSAVDAATGFFADDALSFWSPPASGSCQALPLDPDDPEDGNKVPLGGAANELRCLAPANRKLFRQTSADSTALLCGSTATKPSATALGLPANAPDAEVDQLIAFLCDQRGDPAVVSPMGDPLHSRPILYQYRISGPAESPPTFGSVLFVTTNDGMLHAIDPNTGDELWAFMPSNMLARTKKLFDNDVLPLDTADASTPIREYGLDGTVRLFQDIRAVAGTNDPAPAYLFFGERRGGGNYYALQLDPSTGTIEPELLWTLNSAALGISESWSMPTPTYVIPPGGSTPRPVLIFGGGYDVNHETRTGDLLDDSAASAAIYMVDALTGTLLWKADRARYPDMKYAFPADIRVIDLVGADDIVDRLYAADLGGQVWRFDFDYGGATNGNQPPGSYEELIVGGRMASLGGAEDTSSQPDRRRFFYPPDASLTREGGRVWITLAIGSGHRQFPRSDSVTQDRLYSLRDNTPFAPRPADSYTDEALVTAYALQEFRIADDQVAAVGELSADKLNVGWFLQLEAGEKILSETRTFGGQLFAVSAKSENLVGTCPGYTVRNRLYVLNPKTGQAITNLDSEAGNEPFVDLALRDSISPEAVFLFPPDTGIRDETTGFVGRPAPTCLIGLERCPAPLFNPPVRTFWKQRGQQ